MGGAFGLDFTAVLVTAERRGADTGLLVEVLPEVEAFVVAGLQSEGEE